MKIYFYYVIFIKIRHYLPLIIFHSLHKILLQAQKNTSKEWKIMAKNVVPAAKDALNRFKMEAANEVGVPECS